MGNFIRGLLCAVLSCLCVMPCMGEEDEVFSYVAAGTFSYSGGRSLRVQNVGALDVVKQSVRGGQFAYTFATNSELMVGDGQAAAESKLPPVMVLRDAGNRRLTGGFEALSNFGVVANSALALSGGPPPAHGQWRKLGLKMSTTDYYPSAPAFNIRHLPLKSRKLGDCVMSVALSDFFVCRVPDERRYMSGVFKIVTLNSPDMKKMYYRCSGYEARLGDEQINMKDSFWLTGADGEPVDLSDLKGFIDEALGQVYISGSERMHSDTGLPPWCVHGMAVKKYMDVCAGALCEGGPNFVVMSSIAGFLFVDSAVSVGSELLSWTVEKGTGYKLPTWPGTPKLLGQMGGWGAAKVYEKVSGNQADTGKWMTVGGEGLNIASMLVSFKYGAAALEKVGTWGFKVLDAKKVGEAIRIGKYMIPWQTVDKWGKLFDIKSIGEYGKKAWEWYNTPVGGVYRGTDGAGGVNERYGGVPGGLTFEGDCHGLSVSEVTYDPGAGNFVIDGKVIYKSPLPAAEMAEVLRTVARNPNFGYSLAGSIDGAYDVPGELQEILRLCDEYLGNLVYGRPDRLPPGLSPDPEYRPHRDNSPEGKSVCVNFNFRYNFDLDRNRLLRRNCNVEINMIPVDPEKAREQVWVFSGKLPDKIKVPVSYQKNANHVAAKMSYYSSLPLLRRVMALGEAVAFARTLRYYHMDLKKLAAELSADTANRNEKEKQ